MCFPIIATRISIVIPYRTRYWPSVGSRGLRSSKRNHQNQIGRRFFYYQSLRGRMPKQGSSRSIISGRQVCDKTLARESVRGSSNHFCACRGRSRLGGAVFVRLTASSHSHAARSSRDRSIRRQFLLGVGSPVRDFVLATQNVEETATVQAHGSYWKEEEMSIYCSMPGCIRNMLRTEIFAFTQVSDALLS